MTPMMPPRGHRLIEHTADVIVEAWGPSRTACLEEAVLGFCEIYSRHASTTSRSEFRLPVGPEEELVPRLLEEVIFLLDTADGVPVGALIEEGSGELTGWILLGDRDNVEIIGAGPKAVSRTESRLVRTDTGWSCRALVDV